MEKVEKILKEYGQDYYINKRGGHSELNATPYLTDLRKIIERCVAKKQEIRYEDNEYQKAKLRGYASCRAKTLSNLKERFK